MATTKKLLQAAAGTAYGGAGAGGLDVSEVFSTYVYTGDNGSNRDITNGIDLSTEGGMVWWRPRDNTDGWGLIDTERGAGKNLRTHGTFSEYTDNGLISAFNTDGYRIGGPGGSYINSSSNNYVSYSFRKAPKFFDVVTYTGNGVAGRTVSHNLGSVPGCIIVKSSSAATNWKIFHRGLDATNPSHKWLEFDTGAVLDTTVVWNDTEPTSTEFTVGTEYDVNGNGVSYVAYLFAHNDGDGEFGPTGDQDIIKCGSYTATNSDSNAPEINLGFEPQYLLVKNITSAHNWYILDTMRGIPSGGTYPYLNPNLSSAEATDSPSTKLTATGFIPQNRLNFGYDNTYIYIAIRRGPMAVPTDATDVFAVDLSDTNSDTDRPCFISGFPVDFAIYANPAANGFRLTGTRLTGAYHDPTTTAAEGTSANWTFDWMNGWRNNFSSANYPSWMWRRAPNFFDVVCYDGGSNPINHNLGVTPEMIWVKRRDSTSYGAIYHKDTGLSKNFDMPSSSGAFSNPTYTSVNSASFSGQTTYTNINYNGAKYVAYLFASLDGVSKVGSYTGNGTTQNIDCGFSNGARFVLIKRADGTGDWEIYDTARGINTGNDSHLQLNTNTAEFLSADTIDPYNAGFTVSVDGTDIRSNTSGASYVFYAIA